MYIPVVTGRRAALAAGVMLSVCTGAARADGAADRVHEIVENVRANEQLYRNIELGLRETYELREPAGGRSVTMMATIDEHVRAVLQDGLLYFKTDGKGVGVDEEQVSADTEQAFDGAYTRVYERKSFGNIRHGRFQDARVPRPHTMIFRIGKMAIPLSAQLRASEYNQRAAIRVSYAGDEALGSLECVRIRVDLWHNDAPEPPAAEKDHWDVWLATERNYLPIRLDCYVAGFSATLPIETGIAGDLREISPGVWFPFRVKITVFNEWELPRGKPVVSAVIEYAFETAALDPDYPKSLFSDVQFPKGTPVYEVQDGKVIRSWLAGERGESASGGPIDRRWIILFNVVISVLAITALVRKFRRARRARAA